MILEHWRDSQYGVHLAKLAQQPVDLEEHRLEAEFLDTLKQLDKYHPLSKKEIAKKLARGEPITEEEKEAMRQPDTPVSAD